MCDSFFRIILRKGINDKMKAWLVVNGFLQTEKFHEIHQWLCRAGQKHHIDITMKTNQELLVDCGQQKAGIFKEKERVDFVLFWDKDIRLARMLEAMGYFVVNSAQGIENCDDKGLTHEILSVQKITMPRTILAPMTYSNIGYTNLEFLDDVIRELGLPLVIKENFGSFGAQVYLCNTIEEVHKKTKELEGRAILYQEFIEEAKGRDVRLQVVGDKVVAAMERTAKQGDFRANITNGGKMSPYHPTKAEEKLAVDACRCLSVDFAGVDLLFTEGGTPLVCEVNSNAHFKNIYDCTGVNVADIIMEYITRKISEKKENCNYGM